MNKTKCEIYLTKPSLYAEHEHRQKCHQPRAAEYFCCVQTAAMLTPILLPSVGVGAKHRKFAQVALLANVFRIHKLDPARLQSTISIYNFIQLLTSPITASRGKHYLD